jgi:recombination directionality factor gp3-like protein
LCDPELCREYQNRQCNLSGRFIFFIPDIKSIGAFELHTNSFYAMNAAIQKFATIAFMRGGRISGFLTGSAHRSSSLRSSRRYHTSTRRGARSAWRTGSSSSRRRSTSQPCCGPTKRTRRRSSMGARRHVCSKARGRRAIRPVISRSPTRSSRRFQRQETERRSCCQARALGERAALCRAASAQCAGGRSRAGKREGGNGPTIEQVINAAADFGIDGARYAAYGAKR